MVLRDEMKDVVRAPFRLLGAAGRFVICAGLALLLFFGLVKLAKFFWYW
jgi:hypothetical protein